MNPHLVSFFCTALFLGSSCAAFAESFPTGHRQPVLGSTVFDWNSLRVQPTGVGERRDVANQPTATLDDFECHASLLNAGQSSHPPHRHPQEELIVLREGTLDVFINGKTQRIGPGSVFFFASYDLHNVKNVGTTAAQYDIFNFSTPITHQLPPLPAAETAAPDKLRSAVFDWRTLPVKATTSGERRAVFDSPTVTCLRLECHVTTLMPGASAHPPHHHPDEEIILVREGAVEVTINGQPHHAGAGSICFFASNDEHVLKNAGTTPATYYVIRAVTKATPPKTSI